MTFYLATEVFHRICSLLPSCLSPLKSWDGIFSGGRVVTPFVTEGLIKLIKLQLNPNARLNQDTKVWNQMQR
jgi:hypothetical protein